MPTPVPNYFPLFKAINSHLVKSISSFGTCSAFGSIRKNNFGLSSSLSHWNVYNWEGAIAVVPESIHTCNKLTPEICKQRSIFIVKSIKSELSAIIWQIIPVHLAKLFRIKYLQDAVLK